VKFANGLWMGVEVKPGATTLLRPGLLKIDGQDLWGNKLLDPETHEIVGETRINYNRIALVPTRVLVTFGNLHKLTWPDTIEIKEGEITTLRPGTVEVRSVKTFRGTVKTADGQPVGEISSGVRTVALPAGQYTLELDTRQIPFRIVAGADLVITGD
jgi:hypothetical protein